MAWNASAWRENGGAKPVKKARFRWVPPVLALVAGACAVFCFILQRDTPPPASEEPARKRLARRVEAKSPPAARPVAKQAAPTNRVVQKADVVVWRGREYPRFDKDGGEIYLTGYGPRYHSKVVITNSAARKLVHWAAGHFTCPTDRRILELMDTEPGTAIIGGLKYDPDFTRRFRESLATPIVVEADDTEELKLIKESIIDIRRDLASRLEKGEDIGRVIHDTQTELQQLGAYKTELRRQVEEIMRRPETTESDLDDCIKAANIMLEERGLSPMTVPAILRNGIRMREKRLKGNRNDRK